MAAGSVINFLVLCWLPPVLVALAVTLEYSGFDLWWEALFYDAHRPLWLYAGHWLFEAVIYSGGQLLDRAAAIIWLAGFVLVHCRKKLAGHRKILLYFLLATALGPVIVGIGKSCSHIYSPWDLRLFHGQYPYIRLFDHVPSYAPAGYAFPAGHASGGYCFVSLYFVFLRYRPSYRRVGLLCGVMLGLIFGMGQQIRGAHFPSHDLFSLAICWSVSLCLYFLFYPQAWAALKRNARQVEVHKVVGMCEKGTAGRSRY